MTICGDTEKNACAALEAGASDDEIARIISSLEGGFPACMKMFMKITGVSLGEAQARLRLTPYFIEFFNDSPEKVEIYRRVVRDMGIIKNV